MNIDLSVVDQNNHDLHEISGYVEKLSLDYKVSMGMYVFKPRVLDCIPFGQYLDFPDLVHKVLDASEHVVGYDFDVYWIDLGNPEDFARACQDYERMRE